ncbi:hypothetical protein C0J52_27003 [Blattella germanica]|nr:hypothetical protein C0J52_27003 [Blattella germanica]
MKTEYQSVAESDVFAHIPASLSMGAPTEEMLEFRNDSFYYFQRDQATFLIRIKQGMYLGATVNLLKTDLNVHKPLLHYKLVFLMSWTFETICRRAIHELKRIPASSHLRKGGILGKKLEINRIVPNEEPARHLKLGKGRDVPDKMTLMALLDELEARIREVLANIPHNFLQNYVDSIPGCLRSLVNTTDYTDMFFKEFTFVRLEGLWNGDRRHLTEMSEEATEAAGDEQIFEDGSTSRTMWSVHEAFDRNSFSVHCNELLHPLSALAQLSETHKAGLMGSGLHFWLATSTVHTSTLTPSISIYINYCRNQKTNNPMHMCLRQAGHCPYCTTTKVVTHVRELKQERSKLMSMDFLSEDMHKW